MPVHVQEQGTYELFETPNGNRILVLEGELWYAWVEGQQGEILVHSDADHERRRTLREGRFYVAAFEDDPAFRDVPHLFLEKEGRFQEVVLPNGLPTERDVQKKIIATDNMIDSDTLERHLRPPPAKGEAEQAPASDLPIERYDALTVDEVADRLDALSAAEIEALRRYEAAHKNRKTLRQAFDRRLRQVQ